MTERELSVGCAISMAILTVPILVLTRRRHRLQHARKQVELPSQRRQRRQANRHLLWRLADYELACCLAPRVLKRCVCLALRQRRQRQLLNQRRRNRRARRT